MILAWSFAGEYWKEMGKVWGQFESELRYLSLKAMHAYLTDLVTLLTVLSRFLFFRRLRCFVGKKFLFQKEMFCCDAVLNRKKKTWMIEVELLLCRFQFSAMTAIVLVEHFFTFLATNASIVIHITPA